MSLVRLPPSAMPQGETVESQHLLDLQPIPREVSVARGFVKEHLPALDESGRETVVLLASELVTNVVVHARTSLRLGVSVSPNYVVVTVRDLDLGNTEIMPSNREGGRGLLLVEALSDACGMFREPEGGKIAWFRVSRRAADSPTP